MKQFCKIVFVWMAVVLMAGGLSSCVRSAKDRVEDPPQEFVPVEAHCYHSSGYDQNGKKYMILVLTDAEDVELQAHFLSPGERCISGNDNQLADVRYYRSMWDNWHAVPELYGHRTQVVIEFLQFDTEGRGIYSLFFQVVGKHGGIIRANYRGVVRFYDYNSKQEYLPTDETPLSLAPRRNVMQL